MRWCMQSVSVKKLRLTNHTKKVLILMALLLPQQRQGRANDLLNDCTR